MRCKRLLVKSESKREVERGGAEGSRFVENPKRTGAGEVSENVAEEVLALISERFYPF